VAFLVLRLSTRQGFSISGGFEKMSLLDFLDQISEEQEINLSYALEGLLRLGLDRYTSCLKNQGGGLLV